MTWRWIKVGLPLLGMLALSSPAAAQEIQVTGPLAGAPAVRNLRLHRKGRFELMPTFSATLLDAYQRNFLVGLKATYNFTDYFGLGIWGAGNIAHPETDVTHSIQQNANAIYDVSNPSAQAIANQARLAPQVGQNFSSQLGTIQWIISPQVMLVPFRGKLSIFEKFFVDTDAYFFAGVAIVGLNERANCTQSGANPCASYDSNGNLLVQNKPMSGQIAPAPTFGLGLNFYAGQFMSINLEYRAFPFSWNTGGLDTRGAPPNQSRPDGNVDSKDQTFQFNQLVTLGVGFYLPTSIKLSD